ncbi:MAG: hypothetical protein R3C49_25920 [Planctomycetaceae bacterium]
MIRCVSIPVLICILSGSSSLIFCSGCGGSQPADPAAVDTTAPTAQQSPAPAAATAAATAPPAAVSDRSRRPNERWTSTDGVQYLGNVPLDIFFDQPYAVAADSTPVAGGTAIGAGMAGGTPGEAVAAAEAPTTSTTPQAAQPAAAAGGTDWADVIPIQVLDAEVTNIRNFLQPAVQSVGSFNSSMLMIPPKAATVAALAEVAAKHSGDISWKENAAYVRDLAKRMNEGTIQRGKKDQERILLLFENMVDTLAGSRPGSLEEPPAEDSFAESAELRLLMIRMEEAEKRMKNEAGNETSFSSRKDMVIHEAAVLAALCQVATQKGYGFEDDTEFKGHTRTLIDATHEIRNAAESGSFSAYELARTKLSTSCNDCHQTYR